MPINVLYNLHDDTKNYKFLNKIYKNVEFLV